MAVRGAQKHQMPALNIISFALTNEVLLSNRSPTAAASHLVRKRLRFSFFTRAASISRLPSSWSSWLGITKCSLPFHLISTGQSSVLISEMTNGQLQTPFCTFLLLKLLFLFKINSLLSLLDICWIRRLASYFLPEWNVVKHKGEFIFSEYRGL